CMDESRNKKLTLTDENEPSLNGKRLEYYQDGRQKYVNLGKGAIPIYNNTVKIDGEIIIPKDGSITLVDNNDNGDYDVIKTIEYFSGVVENKTEENISIRSFKNIKIDKDKKVEYKGDIKVGSIASVIESENYLGFVVSEEKVSGKISEVFDRNNIIKIILNGKKYKLT
ncbi:MAG: hypothetical protein RR957_06135, partial [Oscillospiraceae bacterium]